jgi:hypothetical protein
LEKTNLGGVAKVWFFDYKKYPYSQIVTSGNFLISYPQTVLFNYSFLGDTSANETQEENAGGKFYNQSISFTFSQTNNDIELTKFLTNERGIIFTDRNGVTRVFGLFNGLTGETLNYTTDSSKQGLNGFKISFNGVEEKGSYFINDIENAGFIFVDNSEFLLQEDGDFLLQENNSKIRL